MKLWVKSALWKIENYGHIIPLGRKDEGRKNSSAEKNHSQIVVQVWKAGHQDPEVKLGDELQWTV